MYRSWFRYGYVYIHIHKFDAIYIYTHDLSGRVTSPLTLHILIFIWMFCNQAELAIVRSEAGEGAEAGLDRGFIIRFMGDRWLPWRFRAEQGLRSCHSETVLNPVKPWCSWCVSGEFEVQSLMKSCLSCFMKSPCFFLGKVWWWDYYIDMRIFEQHHAYPQMCFIVRSGKDSALNQARHITTIRRYFFWSFRDFFPTELRCTWAVKINCLQMAPIKFLRNLMNPVWYNLRSNQNPCWLMIGWGNP